jgi:hypothetical protein
VQQPERPLATPADRYDPTCDTIGGLESLRLGDLRFLGLQWLELRTNPGP